MLYRDRADAGRRLAAKLTAYAGLSDVLVLGLPRGGVPVALEVAQALGAPWDVFLVRKVGVPGREELAMGALASGGVSVVNEGVIRTLGIPDHVFAATAAKEEAELARRELAYRDGRSPPEVRGRIVVLVDDGLATGATMRAAVAALRKQQPGRIVVAVPVGVSDVCVNLEKEADEVICASTPEPFHAVGFWYEDFSQVTDEEVRGLLGQAGKARKE